jgi:hypothetical protein
MPREWHCFGVSGGVSPEFRCGRFRRALRGADFGDFQVSDGRGWTPGWEGRRPGFGSADCIPVALGVDAEPSTPQPLVERERRKFARRGNRRDERNLRNRRGLGGRRRLLRRGKLRSRRDLCGRRGLQYRKAGYAPPAATGPVVAGAMPLILSPWQRRRRLHAARRKGVAPGGPEGVGIRNITQESCATLHGERA